VLLVVIMLSVFHTVGGWPEWNWSVTAAEHVFRVPVVTTAMSIISCCSCIPGLFHILLLATKVVLEAVFNNKCCCCFDCQIIIQILCIA